MGKGEDVPEEAKDLLWGSMNIFPTKMELMKTRSWYTEVQTSDHLPGHSSPEISQAGELPHLQSL